MKQKRNTIILLCVIIVLAAGSFLVKSIFFGKEGAKAIVTQHGKVIHELPLNKSVTITIQDGNGGSNTLSVKDGMISMTEADCPDLVCVYTGEISQTGQVIACLPHDLIITIQTNGGDAHSIDSTTW